MSTLRSVYRRARRIVRRAAGRDVQFPVQTQLSAERHGSGYGGWWIHPAGIDREAVVYSVGIGTDITFDLSLIERYGVTVHAFDPTPGSIAYLERQSLPPEFRWRQVGLANFDGGARFLPPADPTHISHTLLQDGRTDARAIDVEVRRLSTVMSELGHEAVDLLKMDIEGAEYDVLDDILDHRLPVRQILVEFHHRFPGVGVARTRRAVERLNAGGYRIFFASENGEEYSFFLGDGASPGMTRSTRFSA
jgi:FkbM family methyltransferase